MNTDLRATILGALKRKLQYSAFRQRWNIGVTDEEVSVVAGLHGTRKQHEALQRLVWMEENREGFCADPFIVACGPASHSFKILYEYYPWASDKGRIDAVDFGPDGFGRQKTVLETPFHLSYPFILPGNDGLVMVPEQSAGRKLSFYKLDANFDVTSHETISRAVELVDPTIVEHNGKHWMFATHAGSKDNAELHLYCADDVRGPWTPHAGNPVKSGLAHSRPAGPLFEFRGELFRPAQNCTTHYGSAIVVNRIEVLNEDEFVETPVSEIRPPAGSRYDYGLHTISSARHLTVIDGARMESAFHPRLDALGRFVRPTQPRNG